MTGWWSGTAADFVASDPVSLCDRLAAEAVRRFRINEQAQLRAWDVSIGILRQALAGSPDWHVVLEFGIVRLGMRADAVLVGERGILVLAFRIGADTFDNAARRQVEDYAIDLQDFHAGSRGRPIVPILIATDAVAAAPMLPLLLGGVTPVLAATPGALGALIRALDARLPATLQPIDPASWERARYRPVPGVIDAARHLFARHDVADIASARADATNLTLTTAAIDRLLAGARASMQKLVLFVTGIPGAGKTLCGLTVTFAREGAGRDREQSAAFLTGNPALVHVLREALVRDAVRGGRKRDFAQQQMSGFIQALPRFRDDNIPHAAAPPERVIVIDEAQRCWNAAQAVGKSRDRAVRLDRSEPAHLLDIMGRHEGFAALVCLVGNGQEIHDGEGGLAEWGEALAVRPAWRVACSPVTLADPRPRSRLPSLPSMRVDDDLHLTVGVRSVRHAGTAAWVDAVLGSDAPAARGIADAGGLPFALVRDVAALRNGLRQRTGDGQRAGLVASAGAKRLRADGLGNEVPPEPDAIARWFLDSWQRDRDVRASDALETIATQFSVQGLELDHVGLAWDGDLIRGRGDWLVRRFAGKEWQTVRQREKIENCLNTYRVLLTRARYGTIIYVPRGDDRDPTRPTAHYEAIADFLTDCGVEPLAPAEAALVDSEPTLL